MIWVLAAVVVSLVVGFCIGRTTQNHKEQRAADQDRRVALSALVELLKSVEDLTIDVDSRSSEMQAVQTHVGGIQASGELEKVRQVLLQQMASVLESNQKLEDDLVYARCRMEEQAEELDRARREAHTDALSGVANRKSFDEKLLLLLGALKRGGEPFVLILCDMDHFKWINDTHGHQAGDNVLRQFGQLLRKCVRDGDVVARYGGDEFALLLPKIELPTGLKIADRLRTEVTRTNFGLGSAAEEAAVTLSVGVAMARKGDTPESIIERADEGLYASKRGGRNQVHFQPAADQAADPEAPKPTMVGGSARDQQADAMALTSAR
jgi:diguanylate cyclase